MSFSRLINERTHRSAQDLCRLTDLFEVVDIRPVQVFAVRGHLVDEQRNLVVQRRVA